MAHLVFAKSPGNPDWYTNSPCAHAHPMEEFNKHPSEEQARPIMADYAKNCLTKAHVMIGQNVDKVFASEPGERAPKQYVKAFDATIDFAKISKTTYDIFHDGGVYVSLDGIKAGKVRARVLFIYDTDPGDQIFQLNCTFNDSQARDSMSRIRSVLHTNIQGSDAITDDQLAATMLARIIEKAANTASNVMASQLMGNMPLGLTLEPRPVDFPQEEASNHLLAVGEPNHPNLDLDVAFHAIDNHDSIFRHRYGAMEDEVDKLLAPMHAALLAEEKKELESVVVDQKDAAVLVDDQDLSCFDHIGIFFTALLETLMDCLGACWNKARDL